MEHMDGWCIDPTECKSSWAVAELCILPTAIREFSIFQLPNHFEHAPRSSERPE